MATPIYTDFIHLVNDDSQNHYARKPSLKKPTIILKCIELTLALLCLIFFSQAHNLEFNIARLAIAYFTFGAYLIIPAAILIGIVLGEITPKLLVGYNILGAILFITVGALNIDTWWRMEAQMSGEAFEIDFDSGQTVANIKLVTGITALLNSTFYLADFLFVIVNLCY